ncbi:MAG: Clp protease N-terminal domain-containing protein, partial [Acidobacteria bacterium]|nr:Clp protease N-terminal domain-containing protein [Acidobacteriota bacterium]
MVDLGTYKDRFGETGQKIFEGAMGESKRRDQNYLAVEHILHAFVTEESELFDATMRDLALDPVAVRVLIERRLDNARFQHVGKGLRIAPET